MAAMQVPEEALDGALVLAGGFMVLFFDFGVADVGFAVFAPVFWGGFPVFGHIVGLPAWRIGGWDGRSVEKKGS